MANARQFMAERTAAWSGKQLPYLRRVAYLKTTGKQLVRTGLRVDSGLWRLVSRIHVAGGNSENHIVGSSPALGRHFSLVYARSNIEVRLAYMSNVAAARSFSFPEWCDYDVTFRDRKQSIKIGDNFSISSSYAWDADKSRNSYITIGATDDIGVLRYASLGTRYQTITIWHDGSIACRLVPVLDKSERPCFFDEVSGQLLYNIGTGDFTWGELDEA